jgi:hypothetical protein
LISESLRHDPLSRAWSERPGRLKNARRRSVPSLGCQGRSSPPLRCQRRAGTPVGWREARQAACRMPGGRPAGSGRGGGCRLLELNVNHLQGLHARKGCGVHEVVLLYVQYVHLYLYSDENNLDAKNHKCFFGWT